MRREPGRLFPTLNGEMAYAEPAQPIVCAQGEFCDDTDRLADAYQVLMILARSMKNAKGQRIACEAEVPTIRKHLRDFLDDVVEHQGA